MLISGAPRERGHLAVLVWLAEAGHLPAPLQLKVLAVEMIVSARIVQARNLDVIVAPLIILGHMGFKLNDCRNI